ncbi:MAG: ATP-binding cassette domain-containing protein [Clostridium sp.]|nr:ATP-binding cassette domain-containing protein [Clostridium sp.]
MLKLANITKTYKIGNIETQALKGVSVSFRKNEFVAILGTSGSGKTTTLNIIGGLDNYTSGDLILNGKSTKNFTEKDWNSYRNNSIGFIFQSYNLITHLSIVENVELGMTLSGVSSKEKHKKALEALEKVGLKDHLHKKPNQLSGGQMQRVAIARALANDPDIILADEPTGALDTATSVDIMNLIKEVAKDKLVIMVTHNPELAHEYADRIVEFKDGNIISDSNPFEDDNVVYNNFSLKKTSMNFLTALKLSFTNIKTKKGRTALTAFASSIGIIGIAVIMSLSSGFQTQITKFQRDSFSSFPITISEESSQINMDELDDKQKEMLGITGEGEKYPTSDEVYSYDSESYRVSHKNNITNDYIKYIENINPYYVQNIGYTRLLSLNLLKKTSNGIRPVNTSDLKFSSYPETLGGSDSSYLETNYDLLSGSYPENPTDVVLVVDDKNRVSKKALATLGFELNAVNFKDLVGLEFKEILNNDYYTKTNLGTYTLNTNYEEMYNSNNSITLKITGIVRGKEDAAMATLNSGISYSDKLDQMIIANSINSDIVNSQKDVSYNILTHEAIDDDIKSNLIARLGGTSAPYMISIYPNNFNDKDQIINYLDAYNEDKPKNEQVIYTDLADKIISMTSGIMTGITVVLIAFAGISLVVSLIMIGIITYTSVLERTKEIGILKALGASKKDITRVFDAETFILGGFSGILGIVLAYLLTFPINSVIYSMTDLKNVAKLPVPAAIALIIISTVLTMLGGHIPARMASKKDAVEALRNE